MLDLSDQALWEMGVLKIVELLHMNVTGIDDSLSVEEGHALADYLTKRLRQWRASLGKETFAFDATVKCLIETAVSEWERR